MQSGSTITVNNGAGLYVYGFITGSGAITAKNGAEVYECFQLTDYRGGSQSTDMKNKVFAVSQYYVQNIEAPITFEAGAIEKGWAKVNVSLVGVQGSAVNFIGSSGALFNLTSGSVTKRYDGATDRLVIDLNGTITISSMTIKVSLATINSAEYVLPITNNISLTLHNGSTVNSGQDMCILPGAQIYIEEGATFNVSSGNNIYVYDEDQWGTYCFNGADVKIAPVKYAPGRTYTRNANSLGDASIRVNGTLNVQGSLYTTASGANIYSTSENGKVIIKAAGTATTTYQLRQAASTYDTITITPAKLKNADGSYFEKTANVTAAHTFVYKDGAWGCETHSIDNGGNGVATKEPSCKEPGITTKTCTVCGHQETEEIPVVDHDYDSSEWFKDDENHWNRCKNTLCEEHLNKAPHEDSDDEDRNCDTCNHSMACVTHTEATREENRVESTCTKLGSYDKVTYCSVCDDVIKTESISIPTIAHTLTKTEAVTATCSKPGNIAYWTCSACGKYFSHSAGTDIYEIEENKWVTTVPHTPGDEATCTTAQICTVCKTELVAILGHDYDEQFTIDQEATCTEAGSKSRHCSRCDSTTEVTEIPAIEHDWDVTYTVNEQETECTASGVCLNNPEHTVSATVEITSEVKSPATCTEDGTTTYTADFTGYDWAETKSEDVQDIPAAHKPGAEATCATDQTCTACGVVLNEKLGHIDTEPNLVCDREGCKAPLDCEHVKTETIPSVDATCTEPGLTEGTKCSVCGEVLVEQEVIPVADHTEETIPGTDATCTETGLTDGTKCSVCGEVLEAQEEIPVADHTEAAAVKENEVPATCAKEGSYDNVVYCVDCKTELNRKTIAVPATGAHNYVPKWNESSKWRACGCGQKEDGSEQSREFTLVFKGYDDASDIELTGTYQ
ncbi:MAG: hypothetical protein IJW70_06270 [Clostridia bacterium]|nr:hypothetical protein [Clostridia bacterium]